MKSNLKNINICVILLLFSTVIKAQGEANEFFKAEYIKNVLQKTSSWQLSQKSRRAKNDWTYSVFFTGLYSAWEATHSEYLYNALLENGIKTNWSPYKRYYHADDIAISSTYIDLYRIEKKKEMLQPSIDTIARYVNESYPVKDFMSIKYWWADALFMAPPVLIKLGLTIGRAEYLEYNDQLYMEAYHLLYNKKEKLFARDSRFIEGSNYQGTVEANGKPMFWSRGNGWVLAGLARILEELPEDYKQRHFYERLFKQMAARIIELQSEDGMWASGLLDSKSYKCGEASGSALFCYGLAYGINNNLLKNHKYKNAVQKAWIALNKCVDEEGRFTHVQGAGDRPSNHNFTDNTELYGTGAFLLAGCEMLKMEL